MPSFYCNTFSLTTSQYPYFSQNQEALADLQHYQEKEGNKMLMFGGNEASCSKEHVKQEGIACGFHGFYGEFDQKCMLINDAFFYQKPFNSDGQLQCDVEQVKQLISNNHDEGKEMLYYY